MDIKKGIKAWLIFFRAHTAILEAPMAALGAALAIGNFWNVEVLKWAIFGAIYHYVGYGMNSYADWVNGYDKHDPNKSHHPLNSGDISPSTAKVVMQTLFIGLLVYAIVASRLKLEPLAVLSIMVLTGVLYNYAGKLTEHKYFLVAVVHTTVFVLPYMAYSNMYSNIIWIAALAYFIHHVFQILISGDVKDVKRDESSLIQSMGMEVERTESGKEILNVSPRIIALSYIITIMEIVLVVAILLFLSPPTETIIITITMMVWMVVEIDTIVGEGEYNRDERIAAMSRKELAGLWMIFGAFTGEIGIDAWLGMIGISVLYFVPISKTMWGSMTPDV
jgi:4-hydroxybenzoate polyprenyltransferase